MILYLVIQPKNILFGGKYFFNFVDLNPFNYRQDRTIKEEPQF